MARRPVTSDATARGRRMVMAGAAATVVAAGLVVHFSIPGPFGSATADALYAVLVYLVVAGVLTRMRSVPVGIVAFGLCALIELFQLTGLPLAWASVLPPVRLVLGTTFVATDLAAYAAGVVVVGAVDAALRWSRRDRSHRLSGALDHRAGGVSG